MCAAQGVFGTGIPKPLVRVWQEATLAVHVTHLFTRAPSLNIFPVSMGVADITKVLRWVLMGHAGRPIPGRGTAALSADDIFFRLQELRDSAPTHTHTFSIHAQC